MIIDYLDMVLGLDFLDNVYLITAILVIIGALYCFLGCKIFKLQMAIAGFIAGLVLGLYLFIGAAATLLIAIVIGIVIGIACAIAAFQFFRVGIFISVGLLGFVAGYLLLNNIIAAFILGIIVGIVGFFNGYHVIIISSSVFGGVVLGMGLTFLFDVNIIIFYALSAILIGCGLWVQYKINRADEWKEKTSKYHSARDGSITQNVDKKKE